MRDKKEKWDIKKFYDERKAREWQQKQYQNGYCTLFSAQTIQGKYVYFVMLWKKEK